MKMQVVLALVLLVGPMARAQETAPQLKAEAASQHTPTGWLGNRLSLNLFPVAALAGAEVTYMYKIAPRFSAGVFGSFLRLKDTGDNAVVEQSSLSMMAGALGKLYLIGDADSHSMYLLGGYQYAQTRVNMKSTLFGVEGSGTGSGWGPVAGLGGQLIGRQLDNSKIFIDLAALYGYGYAVASEGRFTSSRSEVNVDLRSGFWIETAVGWMF